jgi:hypothetical protein
MCSSIASGRPTICIPDGALPRWRDGPAMPSVSGGGTAITASVGDVLYVFGPNPAVPFAFRVPLEGSPQPIRPPPDILDNALGQGEGTVGPDGSVYFAVAHSKSFRAYDPVKDLWRSGVPSGTGPQTGSVALVSTGTSIFALGGQDTGGSDVADVTELSFPGGTVGAAWAGHGMLPMPASGCSSAFGVGRVFVACGLVRQLVFSAAPSDVGMAGRWDASPPTPFHTAQLAIGGDGRVYAIQASGDVATLRPGTMDWMPEKSLGRSGAGLSVGVLADGRIWAVVIQTVSPGPVLFAQLFGPAAKIDRLPMGRVQVSGSNFAAGARVRVIASGRTLGEGMSGADGTLPPIALHSDVPAGTRIEVVDDHSYFPAWPVAP